MPSELRLWLAGTVLNLVTVHVSVSQRLRFTDIVTNYRFTLIVSFEFNHCGQSLIINLIVCFYLDENISYIYYRILNDNYMF